MTPDEILDEIRDLPVGEIISDTAAGFIIWYMNNLGETPRDDFENLMYDHWVDYMLHHGEKEENNG